jgi:hypothetical protein
MTGAAKLIAFMVLGGGLVLGGCSGQDPLEEQREIIDNLVQAGYPAGDIDVFDGQVYVAKDALVTLEASREMLETVGTDEQYRTTNLVDASRVQTICLVPTSGFVSKPNLNAGLDGAINNYNKLNLALHFQRGGTGCDATINLKVGGQTGGSSGFPSGGRPYGSVQIGAGLNNYSVAVNTHVITHEIGHCIGLRHSDYYNRSISCGGSATNEGASSVGAILIEGTSPTAVRGGSVMNSCFRSQESGDWLGDDVKALTTLY